MTRRRIPIQIGEKYGKWTVVAATEKKLKSGNGVLWIVDCACGTKGRMVLGYRLANGRSPDCGCSSRDRSRDRKRSLGRVKIGQTYGLLTVVANHPDYGRRKWIVDCACGTKGHVAFQSSLMNGTRSCGCRRGTVSVSTKEKRKQAWTREKRAMTEVIKYQRSALRRGYVWSLSDAVAIELLGRSCVFCGTPPSRDLGAIFNGDALEPCLVNGIDRWDSAKGYEPGNSVPCCWPCNRGKGPMSGGEYLGHVKKAYEHCRGFFEGLDSQKRSL